ncbi:MAG TPA: hypothetical protein VFY93_12910 [Planctomycetota bacterium]|nr:hypothetical protein [Planctomycetota bacterium]
MTTSVMATGLALVFVAGCSAPARVPDEPYGFSKPPYVHPRIIEDLSTWLSDCGDQVVAINLTDSQNSNRYFGDVLVNENPGEAPFVYARDGTEIFGYEHVGTTGSGIHVLLTESRGGGTGVFVNLLLVRFEHDDGVDADWEEGVIRRGRPRLLIRKLGEIGLGDRWSGSLRVRGDEVFVGKDEGVFAGTTLHGPLSSDPRDRILTIRLDPE